MQKIFAAEKNNIRLYVAKIVENTHGKDVPQPPVVVLLRGQLLLARVVQHEELLGQDLKLRVPHGTELHL